LHNQNLACRPEIGASGLHAKLRSRNVMTIRALVRKLDPVRLFLWRGVSPFIARAPRTVAEEQLQLIDAATSIGVWCWDPATDSVWASKRARAILGLHDMAPLARHTLLARIHPEDAATVLQAIQATTSTDGQTEMHLRVVAGAHEVRWIGVNAHVYRKSDRTIRRVVGYVRDESRDKEIEAQLLQQRQQLTHLTRVAMLGELSGGLAHELQQPLTSILCNAQVARHLLEMVPRDDGRLRDILEDVIRDDKRAGQIIQNLRALLMRGDTTVRRVEIGELVSDVLNIVRGTILQSNVRLHTHVDERLPPVHGVRVELEQVLVNLVLNACESMTANAHNDRQLEIRAVSRSRDSAVQITVCDTGRGIATDKLDSVFDPFFTTKHDGLGLGLAICRSIILAHKGRLWAENRRGRGAEFHFTVPAAA
jgi:two-component system, LuxR family, sensor kinase FixL